MVTFKLPSSMLLLFLLLNNIFLCSAEVLYIPVTKDATSLQYITEVGQRTPLVPIKLLVHLGGGSLWVDCDKGYISSTYKPAVCNSTLCSYSKFQFCGDCKFKTQLQPGCNNNTCYIWGDNPLINTYYDRAEVAEYVLAIDSTPGVRVTSPRFIFTCLLDRDMMRLLENGVTGVGKLTLLTLDASCNFSGSFPNWTPGVMRCYCIVSLEFDNWETEGWRDAEPSRYHFLYDLKVWHDVPLSEPLLEFDKCNFLLWRGAPLTNMTLFYDGNLKQL
ncbi:hypothetical protein BC332_02737 [Capsicum chinense]|nr:hypothetical protein BC332_02737 [Capsicum chinense]